MLQLGEKQKNRKEKVDITWQKKVYSKKLQKGRGDTLGYRCGSPG
ncbi:hypothetical protein DBT_0640 [Dissulfuribacter thermophilus]|uniref:Uncharacterized protein n=1 Tax=Dissulfuribacter thermophilus TaxID=1156395 RepID=A0A1B9F8A7_9BACT|nr:hypothetical protein DBT_0640 [Dissulfuribacter thermophilus]